MEEPQHNRPRQTMTLMRLWRTSDVADGIAQFLPTKDISVTIPNLAKTFERDHWRLLTAMMRRARRGTTAACKTALLSTLQMAGRESGHFHEDWEADSSRSLWNVFSGDEEGPVDYTANRSRGTFVLNRRTPMSDTTVGIYKDLAGVGDRCCVKRFRVSLAYTGSYEETSATGSYFRLVSATSRSLCSVCIRSDGTGGFRLRWRTKAGSSPSNYITLKRVLGYHTFHIDATLDWRTETATVTVDGVEIERRVPFVPLPFLRLGFGVNYPGKHICGPVDVWYFSAPPPQPVPSVRFATDPDDGWDFNGGVDE